MYKRIATLVKLKYYKNRDEAESKVDVLYSFGKLTDKEYTDLMSLIKNTYKE